MKPGVGPCPTCGQHVQRTKTRVFNAYRGAGTLLHFCPRTPSQMTLTTAPVDPFEVYDVPRDGYGRPKIKQPNGKDKAYTRCTTYVGCLEDTFNLSKWQQRMVALGLAQRPDLLLSVSAHSDDKRKLDGICEEAREAAAASSAATTGTALHRLAERLDRGEKVDVPAAARADLDAYRQATAGIDWLHVERITVHDGLSVAGTPDRIGVQPKVSNKARVYDIKTGGIDYGMGKIAMQLALYAHSSLYDPSTGERMPLDVDLDTAVVIHLPAGTGTCSLVEVDIAAGWEAVQLATQVRAWRARKDLARPMALDFSTASLSTLIDRAEDTDALIALYRSHRDVWTADHTARAAARKALLLGGAA